MTQSLSLAKRDHVILFTDKSKIFISQSDYLRILKISGQNKLFTLENKTYNFSSIYKILDIEEYYNQYPDSRPVQYKTIQEQYPEESFGGNQQIRKPTSRARELMLQGIKQYSTTYTGEEENPVFNDLALVAAKNIQPDKTGLKNIYKSLREDKFAKSLLKQMSYLGSKKTDKKASTSRENGKKGGRPLSGVSKTCLTCGRDFETVCKNMNINMGIKI